MLTKDRRITRKFIGQEDATWLISRLKYYHDRYTRKLIMLLKGFLKHRNIHKLAHSVEDIEYLNTDPFHLKWEFADRITLLDLICPV